MSHQGNDEIIDNERDNLTKMKFKNEAGEELTINPKDYPNVSGLFGNYEYDPECDNYVKTDDPINDPIYKSYIITCPTCEGEGEIVERREEER